MIVRTQQSYKRSQVYFSIYNCILWRLKMDSTKTVVLIFISVFFPLPSENYHRHICFFCICIRIFQFWGARVAQWVRSMDTTHSSLSPIRRGFAPGFVNYNKGCTRLATASDKVCQLLAHGRWFSLASSTTNTGRHDIAEILLKVALKHQKSNQIKSVLEEYDYYLKRMQIGHNINIKNYHPVVYR